MTIDWEEFNRIAGAKDAERVTTESVSVGDTMRMSVELIRDIASGDDYATQLVRVKRVVVEKDGSKLMWVEKA